MRQVAVQLVVGDADIGAVAANVPDDADPVPADDDIGTTRVERLRTLQRNLDGRGLDVRLDLVPGVGHEGLELLPAVPKFFAEVLGRLTPVL